MSQISDLVADSKLETRFHPEAKYVCHVYVESDPTGGQRTVSRREYWQRRKHIGSGGFGSVWLEKCVKGKQEGEMRAVKEIQRPRKQFECDRELEAIAKFSHQRVRLLTKFRYFFNLRTAHLSFRSLGVSI